jgi:WD40 repeat protein/DNA-binding SARP family transcriptional activator
MGVDYRLLGPLAVVRDGVPVELGAYRQRALLGLLLANAGMVLSTERILDELWGETSGTDKQGSLWVYVSGLRTALEPGRAKRSEGAILLTRAPGYVLAVDGDDTDVGRFERAIAEARLLVETDPQTASDTLAAGLAMWRGHAYEEFMYEPWAQAEIARLEELRVEAIEDRLDADLRTGLAHELVPELHSLVRQHPLRERLLTSLMLALYRCGRAAEALRACASFRQRLVVEMGIEPSRAVRDLEHQILLDDGELLLAPTTTRRSSGLTVRGYEMREELGRGAFGSVHRAYQPIVGREVAIKVIRPELADDPAFIRRFEAEAQLVAGLEHPHIVPLYDYWREPGVAYLVMRLVDAGSLADALALGALPADRAATVFGQISSALGAAHRSGVIHRDVTLENILIDRDGNAYLNDFQIARAADGDASPPIRWYTSPEQLSGRPVSPASDIYSLAAVAATALTGMPGEYEQVRGALAPAVRAVLDRATATDPARRYPDAATFGTALRDALGAPMVPPLGETENPYKGLRAFGPVDVGDFFGRERLVERLVARLGEPGTRGRFVAVVGPSGSGKSSVVRAGLVPALRQGALPMSAAWFGIDMTPAAHPFEELEAALARVATDSVTGLLDVLLKPGGVGCAVRNVLPDDQTQLLLVIDQFEELFTQVDEDTAGRFIDELVDMVTAPATKVRVVITLRADFYDRPLLHRGLGELLREGTEVVTPMSVAELGAAITGPASRVGVDVEPAVVSEIITAILDRPGALPLLQYTLTELFDSRVGRTITMAAYCAGGGVSRSLARRADSLLAGLGAETTETARNVFLRLVNLDDSAATVTRRRTLVVELEELDDRGRVERALDAFGRHRLLTFDRDPVTRGPTVEISHEALLTEWDTLRGWIDDAHDDLRTHRHLIAEMTAWTASTDSPDYLLRGARLDAVVEWAGTTTMGLRPAELRFLDASLAARTAEQHIAEDQARRQVRINRRLRALLVGVAVLLAASLVGGLLAWRQRARADDAATEADARRLTALALDESDNERALLFAAEAARLDVSRATRASLLAALSRNPALIASTHREHPMVGLAVSPDGRRIAVGGSETTLYEAATLGRIATSDLSTDKLAFQPGGRQLAVAATDILTDRVVRLLDPATLEETALRLGGLPDSRSVVLHLRYSAGGRFLAADFGGNDANSILVWDVANPERPFGRVDISSDAFALSPDGRFLYAKSDSAPSRGVVAIYDTATGQHLRSNDFSLDARSLGVDDRSDLLEVSPDGTRLAVADFHDLVLLDATTLSVQRRLEGTSEQLNTIEFSHDGTIVAAGTEEGTVVLWEVAAGTRRDQLHGQAGSTQGIAFSPDDATLYSVSDGLLVWDLRGDRRLIRRIAQVVPGDSFSDLAVAPDGNNVAYFDTTASAENADTIQFRDVMTGELGDPIATGHSNWDWRPTDGQQFATADRDGFVRVWDRRRGQLIAERQVTHRSIGGIAYTNDGQRIVVGERSGAVLQVDAETLDPVGDRIERDLDIRRMFTTPDPRTVLVLLTGDAYALIDLVEGTVERRADLGIVPAWLDVSPDGKRLAVGATTGQVGVIDLGSGEWVRPPIDAHDGWVQRVAYAPAGATFASSGDDGQLVLWDGTTGDQLATLVPVHPNVSAAVEFQADGHTLLIASHDGALYTFDTRLESWIDRACTVVPRNLTEHEWTEAIGDRPYHETCSHRPK